LRFQCCRHRCGRGSEGDAKRIANRLEDIAGVCSTDPLQKRVEVIAAPRIRGDTLSGYRLDDV